LAEEFLEEADAERDAILDRAEQAATRIRNEAEYALERSLEEADRERTRIISAAREEIVALRAQADQALEAEASQIVDRARLEADTVRAEADRHALIVRAEAAAAFARRVDQGDAEPEAGNTTDDSPAVQGFIGSGLRRRSSSAVDASAEADARKRRRGIGRLLRTRS
jgi:hypothetical protein